MSIEPELLPPPLPNNYSESNTHFGSQNFQTTSNKILPEQIFDVESEDYYLSEKTFKQEIQQVGVYLAEFKKPKIVTPFKGTSLVMTKDKKFFYFGSREGRIGVAKIDTKETVNDVDLKEGTIWTIALSHSDRFLYSGGQGGQIRKFLVSSMEQINIYKGHTDEVNAILISKDETKMYSTGDDGKVMVWDLVTDDGSPKVLYSVGRICYGMDLSADNQFVATVGGDRSLHFYDLVKEEKVKVLQEKDFGTTWCVAITFNNTYVALGDDRAITYVYMVKTWERVKVFHGHDDRVRCMAATTDERYLITGGIDNKIFIWDLGENRNGIEVLGHDDWVKAIVIAEDQKTFYSLSDDCSIHTWRIPKYDNYVIVKDKLDMKKYTKMLTGHRSAEFIFLMSSDSITRLDRSVDLSEKIMNMSELKVKLFCISPADDKIITVRTEDSNSYYYRDTLKKYTFEVYDSSFLKLREQTLEYYNLCAMIYSTDGKYLILGEMYKVVILYEDTLEVYHEFRSHKGSVANLAISPRMKYVFAFDERSNYMVKTYDFYEKTELKQLIDQNFNRVSEMEISADEDYLIVVPENRHATIWATSKMIKINELNLETCTDIMFHNYYNHLYCLFPECIKTYTLPSMCTSFIIKFRTDACIFTFNYNYNEIIVGLENSIEVWKTPTAVTSLSVYGENRVMYDFYKYTANLVSGKTVNYKADFNSWVIEPFHMNLMHLYAYFNKIDLLTKSIEDNAGFIISRSGFTPLDVCLEMNNEAGIEFFYRYIKKSGRAKPYFTSVLGKSINRILRNESFMTKKFLDLMLNKSLDTTLSRYHHTTVTLPIIVFSPTLFCNKNAFARDKFSNDGQAVEFLQTYFKFNLTTGSRDSLGFINSLLDTKNDQVFTSDFIQHILKLKWKRTRFILYWQAVVFITYMVLLSAYTDDGDIKVLSACFAVNILLIFYEIMQFLCSGEDYFRSLWNYIDIIRSLLMILIWIRDIGSAFPISDDLIALVVFISWVRGISYFRIIKQTRYYINLIYEVCWDVLPFLTILIYSNVAFSLVFERLQDRSMDYFSFLKESWEISQGGFSTQGYGYWMYLAFVGHCLINPIIILNLLIAVMGDTFDRVNSNVVVADSRELTQMILEGELIYFWKRKDTSCSFLHICKSLDTVVEQDEVKKLKVKVGGLGGLIGKIQENSATLRAGHENIKELLRSKSRN